MKSIRAFIFYRQYFNKGGQNEKESIDDAIGSINVSAYTNWLW